MYIYIYMFNEQRAEKEKKETGLQLLVTAKTINYCSRQISEIVLREIQSYYDIAQFITPLDV